jgi:hypothetical protein
VDFFSAAIFFNTSPIFRVRSPDVGPLPGSDPLQRFSRVGSNASLEFQVTCMQCRAFLTATMWTVAGQTHPILDCYGYNQAKKMPSFGARMFVKAISAALRLHITQVYRKLKGGLPRNQLNRN